MTSEQLKKYYQDLRDKFDSPQELSKAIDINASKSISMDEAKLQPELNHFFGLDENGPYSEFLSRGLRSLRVGFYKIVNQPFYNTNINPGTFSSTVYYYYPDNIELGNKVIKYEANIGPISNIHRLYVPLDETPDKLENVPILERFDKEKKQLENSEHDFLIPKTNFYDSIFKQGKVFFVSESIWHPEYSTSVKRPKQVTWSFID